MNEEIDVSDCNYYLKPRKRGIFCDITCFCNGENTPNKQCEDNKECYYKQMKRLEQKLEKIKELCQVPNEPYYNSECEFGKGRIDLGQEILEIIRGKEDE